MKDFEWVLTHQQGRGGDTVWVRLEPLLAKGLHSEGGGDWGGGRTRTIESAY